jgi:aryl-alcohol dehydrogenase-like predicted oxidoreductase
MDHVDLIFCHRPDPDTPIEETVRAMTHLIDQGKASYWGTSEWSAQQITEAYGVARQYHLIPPQMEQPQYNMFHRKRVEREYAHLYSEIGLGTTVWSPLASGMLTGKYSEGIPGNTRVTLKGYEWLHESFQSDEGRARVEKTRRISKVAGELGCTNGAGGGGAARRRGDGEAGGDPRQPAGAAALVSLARPPGPRSLSCRQLRSKMSITE